MTMEVDLEEELLSDIVAFEHDPLGFVTYAYPWGDGELARSDGPRDWQKQVLGFIGDHLKDLKTRFQPLMVAVSSGHGIGKSALISQIIDWAMSTCEDCRVVVTANTESQLRTKTWPEIGKWLRMSINAHWFNPTATAIASCDKEHSRTWRTDAVPWSEANTEAFAGLHNAGKRIVVIYDEASAIADAVWEVTEGALTDADTEIIWIVFGNPTRNSGRFRECFGRLKHRWKSLQIDSRTVEGTNKDLIKKWVEDYGEDSDFVRVRVRGVFPRAGSTQFIPSDSIQGAITRKVEVFPEDPLIMAVDVARFGDDQSVVRFRRGRDARSIPPMKFRGLDTMQLAARVAAAADKFKPDAIFVDETGVGGGVIDRLKMLGYNAIGVNFGSSADNSVDGERCANKKAEIWAHLRLWLKTGGAIEDDRELISDLEGIQYGYNTNNEIQLEKKDDMKKRGLASPDDGDALALTFSHPVVRGEDDDYDDDYGSGRSSIGGY